jgi:hypothetical protein
MFSALSGWHRHITTPNQLHKQTYQVQVLQDKADHHKSTTPSTEDGYGYQMTQDKTHKLYTVASLAFLAGNIQEAKVLHDFAEVYQLLMNRTQAHLKMPFKPKDATVSNPPSS